MSNDLRSLAEVNRLIHGPSRLIIVAILAAVESADFLYLQREASLTRGNLSVQLSKLQEAGYIRIEKMYRGKTPFTLCRLTKKGRNAFDQYRKQLKLFIEKTE